MDRKSFFKRALLAIGAAVVPNAILKTIPKEKERQYGFRSLEVDGSAYRDGQLTLYHQTMIDFLKNHPSNAVNARKFYWAEYDSDEGLKVFQGPKVDPTPITFTIRKT
jgi:hypothetical protein